MSARRPLGLALALLGLVLMLYALASPFIYGKSYIGSQEAWTPDAAAIIIGWYLLMIGPAVAYGETPVAIERIVKRERG